MATINELMFRWYSGLITITTKPLSSLGVDKSITATTTSQPLMAANPNRIRFFVKNDTAIDIWINLGAVSIATAGGGNLKILANGGYFELSGSTSVVNIIAASGTPAITAREF